MEANIFGQMRAFNRDVLRIQPFVCNEIARAHIRHTKEDFLRSSGNPMLQIRRSTEGQVWLMMKNDEFHG